MKLAIETYVLQNRFDAKTAIKMIKEAGFDAFDYTFLYENEQNSMLKEDYLERACALKEYADELGIPCNQAHASADFRYVDPIDPACESYLRVLRSIEAASVLGAENIVVHPMGLYLFPDNPDVICRNRAFFKSLIPVCEKFNMHVAVENLFNGNAPVLGDPEIMNDFIESLDSDRFTICLDLGHLAFTGFTPPEVIRKTNPKYLKALHVHDNNMVEDLHLLPGDGNLNWQEITSALGEIGYDGDFNLEVTGFLEQSENIAEDLKKAEIIGRKLMESILHG